MENTTPLPAQNRYRVFLTEKLRYTVDVLANSEDEARELATESEDHGEPECLFFDAEVIVTVPDEDKTYSPNNGCVKCGARIADELYPHCPACIEQIKANAH